MRCYRNVLGICWQEKTSNERVDRKETIMDIIRHDRKQLLFGYICCMPADRQYCWVLWTVYDREEELRRGGQTTSLTGLNWPCMKLLDCHKIMIETWNKIVLAPMVADQMTRRRKYYVSDNIPDIAPTISRPVQYRLYGDAARVRPHYILCANRQQLNQSTYITPRLSTI